MRIGVDIGGMSVKAGVLDANNRIIARAVVPTVPEKGFDGMIHDIAFCAQLAAERAGVMLTEFPCIGFGCPGMIDTDTGTVVLAGNLGWTNAPAQAALQELLPSRVLLGNDANCAVAGEMVAGAARGCDNVLMLTLGTGVGGGVMLDGKIVTGGRGLGMELGHVKLVYGGEHCTCGMDGCLEAYTSVSALIRDTRRAMEQNPGSLLSSYVAEHGAINGKTVFDCAAQGDQVSAEVIENYIGWLAAGTGGLISTFRPDVVLFGGGLSAQGDTLLVPLRERTKDHTFAGHIMELPPFRQATLGNDAGIIGAAWLDELQ